MGTAGEGGGWGCGAGDGLGGLEGVEDLDGASTGFQPLVGLEGLI